MNKRLPEFVIRNQNNEIDPSHDKTKQIAMNETNDISLSFQNLLTVTKYIKYVSVFRKIAKSYHAYIVIVYLVYCDPLEGERLPSGEP